MCRLIRFSFLILVDLVAQSTASLLHNEHIAELSGSHKDLEKPEYKNMKGSLIRLVVNKSVSLRLPIERKNGEIIFLVDSEYPESPDYSPPRQIYYETVDEYWKPFLSGETILSKTLW